MFKEKFLGAVEKIEFFFFLWSWGSLRGEERGKGGDGAGGARAIQCI